ncbi:kinase-like domain-containing protein [Rhizophagus irregularis DAOM 181602=DAOM 197198]|nr:kinase-like domain-containing protein [Rhizophagus irregularis DAOM 181602=DAOM 197198]
MAGVTSIRWTSYTIKFDKEYQNDQSKEYLLINTNLAYQLTCAVLLLHDKGIVYHNLYPVLLREISSGRPLFKDELYDGNLIKKILQGYRETIVLDTFADYSSLYTECWNNEPDNRSTLMENVQKKDILNILGYCYCTGIGTKIDKQEAFELYEKAADLRNIKAIFNLAVIVIAIKDDTKTFELSKKSAEGGILGRMTMLGHCYQHGIGVDVDMQRAFEYNQMVANLGNNLGDGIKENINKAIY